ncbi:Transmembrane and TPR repeat-containing protein 2 [Portunus trituberculatus]|uniref:Transmembrane and TPR repeat-containing protein 2 n=1 Tax=Portunus trituberculatus TaxID=210409 RepID=A0A5B7G652_PORTR|nr:Transmembrane and TPR repeat-containing protein 2 [Portunus trituberculatus]
MHKQPPPLCFHQSLTLPSFSITAYGNLANILSSQGKKEEAEWAYKKALSYRSNMADVHYNLGILFQEQKRYHEALQEYKLAIQFRPRMASE